MQASWVVLVGEPEGLAQRVRARAEPNASGDRGPAPSEQRTHEVLRSMQRRHRLGLMQPSCHVGGDLLLSLLLAQVAAAVVWAREDFDFGSPTHVTASSDLLERKKPDCHRQQGHWQHAWKYSRQGGARRWR